VGGVSRFSQKNKVGSRGGAEARRCFALGLTVPVITQVRSNMIGAKRLENLLLSASAPLREQNLLTLRVFDSLCEQIFFTPSHQATQALPA